MNQHIIHGRFARDPEFTQGSDENHDRANFVVATDRRYGDETDFFDCVIFGRRAGVIDKYFSKGSEIALTGEGQIRSYEDKNGVKRRAYSIVVSDFDFCGSKKDSTGNSSTTTEKPLTGQNLDDFGQQENDIPF